METAQPSVCCYFSIPWGVLTAYVPTTKTRKFTYSDHTALAVQSKEHFRNRNRTTLKYSIRGGFSLLNSLRFQIGISLVHFQAMDGGKGKESEVAGQAKEEKWSRLSQYGSFLQLQFIFYI